MLVHHWGQVYAEQDIMYLGRQTLLYTVLNS